MKQEEEQIAVHAEVLYGGDVLLTFADGSCAIYSSPLLRSLLPLTERFVDHEFAVIQQACLPLASIPPRSVN